MKRVLLYELPAVLFKEWVALLGVEKTGEFIFEFGGNSDGNVQCPYIFVEAKGKNKVAVALVDTRPAGGQSVSLMIFSYADHLVEKHAIAHLTPFASIESRWMSGDGNGGQWLLVEARTHHNSGAIDFSNEYHVTVNKTFLALTEKAMELFLNEEYEWVTAYNKYDNKPMFIRYEEIKEPELQ